MNTKYSIRLLTLLLIFGLGPCRPMETSAKKKESTPAFSYQMNADSAKKSTCTSGKCGPEEAIELLADNAPQLHGDNSKMETSSAITQATDDEESYTLFGYALGNVSPKNLAVAFFCMMSGMLFLLFGLKGW